MAKSPCCRLRLKIVFGLALRTEEECGVSDSELADVTTFEKSELGRPVVLFRFCPWCGKPWVQTGETREAPKPENSGEEWKANGEEA